MIDSDKAMYLEMFEKNKSLVELIQARTNLNKLKSEVRLNIYNNIWQPY